MQITDWIIAISAGVTSIATIVLAIITGYYAFQTKKLVNVVNQQRLDAIKDKQQIEYEHKIELLRGIIAELKNNIDLCELDGMMLTAPFVLDKWNLYKGEIDFLPLEIQEKLYRTYVLLQAANAPVMKWISSYGTENQESVLKNRIQDDKQTVKKDLSDMLKMLKDHKIPEK